MPIDTIAVVTAGRPRALERCLVSYMENAAVFGRTPAMVVFDDSATKSERAATQTAVESASRGSGVAVSYIGLEERVRIFRDVVSTGAVPRDALAFALFDAESCHRGTIGANRNLMLCCTQGRQVLVVDDDTVCETHVLADSERSSGAVMASASTRNPAGLWPLGRSDEASDVTHHELRDCVGEHASWLGRPVGASAQEDQEERVALTANGLLGDCGWGSPAEYLFLEGASLDRLTVSEEKYIEYVTSRRVMKAVPCTTISGPPADFMTTFFAIDNTGIVPPFLPIARGSDRVFAALVQACCPGWRLAHLPTILRHEPERRRVFWTGEILRSAAGIDVATLLCALLQNVPAVPPNVGAAQRLTACGGYLQDVAAEPAAFAAAATESVRRVLTQQVETLEQAAEANAHRAGAWLRDVCGYAAALRRALHGRDVYLPLDLRHGAIDRDTRELTRRVVSRFGSVLRGWNATIAATRRLAPLTTTATLRA